MQAAQLLQRRFRFTEPDDVATYGDRWWVYDEAAILRQPARDLVRLETEIGMALPDVMDQLRANLTMGLLGATWLAIHLEDPKLAGKFDDHSPIVHLTEWTRIPEPETPKADLDRPLDQTPSAHSADGPATE